MKKMLLMLLLISPWCAAESLKDIGATKSFTHSVIANIKSGTYKGLPEQLKSVWPIPQGQLEKFIAQLEGQRKLVIERYGQPLIIEWVETIQAGKSLTRHIYLEKFETHAVRWEFTFYRPKETWLVNSIYWDDKLDRLLTR